jgi:hypothetical protein
MIYSLTLVQAGLAAGLLLVAAHALALWKRDGCRAFLEKLPRSRPLGLLLLGVAAVWSFLLVWGMDLGEFAAMRGVMLVAIAGGAVLAAVYVPEFLAVRALGMLVLLAAEPLLGAAAIRPEPSRLFVVVLAYVWVVAGLFWVGMPYVLRDQIHWVLAVPARYAAAAWAGLACGALLVFCALVFWM